MAILPAAASGLAYMRNYFDKNDLCGESGLVYMETILSGGSGAQAHANAEAAYKAAWARGARKCLRSFRGCLQGHSSVKEPFSPGGREAEGGRPSLAPSEEWLVRISPPQNGGIKGTMALSGAR